MTGSFGFGALPGDLLSRWPRDEAGDPVPPRYLTHCLSTDLSDTLLVNMLEAYGIPAMVRSPGDGAFGRVILGLSGTGSSIYVPETLYQDAKELMEGNDDGKLQSGV